MVSVFIKDLRAELGGRVEFEILLLLLLLVLLLLLLFELL